MARILHSHSAAALVLAPILSFTTAFSQATPSKNFTGNSLPTPPQQLVPWSPPENTLPDAFVSATTKLFEQGLADPRGCEYREVTVGTLFAEAGTLKVHAWVLPASDNSSQRFAVGWNGLVYPAISVGPAADLSEDVKAAINADEALRENWKRRNPELPFYRFRAARSEYLNLKHESLLPVKASLLLRLGAADLSAKVWAGWTIGMQEGVNDDSVHLKDPYMMLATDWVWALFDRAVTAHMGGNDNLALLSARALIPIQKTVDDEAASRGFEKLYFGSHREGRSFLGFLAPLPALLADQERRALERSNGKVLATKPSVTSNDKAARIAELIQKLDEVAARQLSQPGAIEWSHDQTMNELERQGNDAVEPLLAVLESDTRLTRSVWASRWFHYDRHVAGTHEAAFAVLRMILNTSNFGPLYYKWDLGTMEGRRAIASEIRTYFKKYGRASPSERWYGLLADDSATAEQWEEAARSIVQLTKYDEVTQAMLPAPLMQGERLREKEPSVSSLLLRRRQTLAAIEKRNERPPSLSSASIAAALAAWDGIHYVQELRQFSRQLKDRYDDNTNPDQRVYLQRPMMTLYLKRAESDPEALREYAEWLLTVNPAETGYNIEFLFQPTWHHPDDPAVIEAIDRLFSDPASRWLPIIATYPNTQADTSNLLPTPLLSFASFREAVLRALTDKSVVGMLNPRAPGLDGEYELKVENSFAAAFAGSPNVRAVVITLDRRDDRYAQPKVVTPIRLRTCDVYAWKLRLIDGAPQIKIYWSESQRDAVIDELATFLRNHKGPFVNTLWRSTGMEY